MTMQLFVVNGRKGRGFWTRRRAARKKNSVIGTGHDGDGRDAWNHYIVPECLLRETPGSGVRLNYGLSPTRFRSEHRDSAALNSTVSRGSLNLSLVFTTVMLVSAFARNGP